MKMTDDQIINKLIFYLENSEKLRILKNIGLEWSREYTQEKYAQRFIRCVDKFLRA